MRPMPLAKMRRTKTSLTRTGSMPKYSPRPPQTPAIILLVSLR